MKRAGFTMIELIFVIVILGILAAVAIPKLAATRDDAKISAIIGNARTMIGDITAKRTALGQTQMMTALYTDISSVPAASACGTPPTAFGANQLAGTSALLCDDAVACVTVALDGNASGITVTTAAAGASTVCDGVRNDPAILSYVNGSPLDIGGSQVVR